MKTAPKEIVKAETDIKIVWEDGHASLFTFRALRQACPCAMCRDEWTGRPLLDPETVPESLAASKAELVGNYAIAFQFSDGHSTGIFSFENLRKSCPCRECVGGR